MPHPNAAVTGIAGSATIVVMFALDALGVDVPAEVASAVTTLIAAAVLYVGRRKHA